MEKVTSSPNQTPLDIDPGFYNMAGMEAFTSNTSETPAANTADQDALLEAGLQAAMPMQQFETLAVDPSMSQEQQEDFNDKYVKAVGKVALENETLNQEDLETKARGLRIAEARTAVAQQAAVQHQLAQNTLRPFDTTHRKSNEDTETVEGSIYTLAA